MNSENFAQRFSVDYYHKSDGGCPVEKFLDSLDLKMRTKMLFSIRVLEKMGNPYARFCQ